MSEKNVEEVKSLLKEIKSKFFESYVDYLFDDEKCNLYWNQLEEELQLGLSNVINSIPSFNDVSKPGLNVVRSDREFVMTPISAYSEMSILTDDIRLDYVNLHNILEYELSIYTNIKSKRNVDIITKIPTWIVAIHLYCAGKDEDNYIMDNLSLDFYAHFNPREEV
jgi:hypothetical protein